jgi:hypothetical protein
VKVASTSLVRLFAGASEKKAPEVLTAPAYKLHGVEIFPGVGTPVSRTTRYGATFVATEKSRASTTLIGWINYTPIFFEPRAQNTIVGGRWWLIAAEGIRYRGMLYGSFGEGEVRWNGDAKIAEASVYLKVSGGTRAYRDLWKAGSLTAALNHLPFPPLPPSIGGTLKLERY